MQSHTGSDPAISYGNVSGNGASMAGVVPMERSGPALRAREETTR